MCTLTLGPLELFLIKKFNRFLLKTRYKALEINTKMSTGSLKDVRLTALTNTLKYILQN